MKTTLFFATIIMVVMSVNVFGQGKPPANDQLAIERIIGNWNRAWQTRDH